jgi:hypothetical protein
MEHRIDDLTQLFIKTITFSGEATQSRSFSIREAQINDFFYYLTPINAIFGRGDFALIVSEKLIENLYIAVFHDYGIVGLIFLCFLLLKAIFSSIKTFFNERNVFQIISIIVFALYGMTLHVIMLFNLTSMFIILFFYAFWRKKNTRGISVA